MPSKSENANTSSTTKRGQRIETMAYRIAYMKRRERVANMHDVADRLHAVGYDCWDVCDWLQRPAGYMADMFRFALKTHKGNRTAAVAWMRDAVLLTANAARF